MTPLTSWDLIKAEMGLTVAGCFLLGALWALKHPFCCDLRVDLARAGSDLYYRHDILKKLLLREGRTGQ